MKAAAQMVHMIREKNRKGCLREKHGINSIYIDGNTEAVAAACDDGLFETWKTVIFHSFFLAISPENLSGIKNYFSFISLLLEVFSTISPQKRRSQASCCSHNR